MKVYLEADCEYEETEEEFILIFPEEFSFLDGAEVEVGLYNLE